MNITDIHTVKLELQISDQVIEEQYMNYIHILSNDWYNTYINDPAIWKKRRKKTLKALHWCFYISMYKPLLDS